MGLISAPRDVHPRQGVLSVCSCAHRGSCRLGCERDRHLRGDPCSCCRRTCPPVQAACSISDPDRHRRCHHWRQQWNRARRSDRDGQARVHCFRRSPQKRRLPPLQEHGCHPVLLDVSKQQSVMNAVKEVQAALKAADNHLCAIVNNAGVSPSFLPLELESPDSVAFQMGVNTMGVLTTTQHFLPLLRAIPGGGGRIVTVGSVFGLVSMGDTGVYCMSKHAVEAFTGALRAEVAPWKIAVSVLNPGFVRTELANKREEQEADALAKLHAQFPEDMQQVYPSVFSEQLRTAQMAEAKKQFGASPTAAQTTTPAILHAITSSRPEPSYKLSSLTPSGGFPTVEVFIWFYSFLSDAVKARIFTAYYNGGKKVINNSKTD